MKAKQHFSDMRGISIIYRGIYRGISTIAALDLECWEDLKYVPITLIFSKIIRLAIRIPKLIFNLKLHEILGQRSFQI